MGDEDDTTMNDLLSGVIGEEDESQNQHEFTLGDHIPTSTVEVDSEVCYSDTSNMSEYFPMEGYIPDM